MTEWPPVLKCIVCALLLGGCRTQLSSDGTPLESSDGHRRMVKALALLQSRAADEHPFFQTRSARQAEARLSQLSSQGDNMERFLLHQQLCDDYRRLGQMQQAIEHVEAAASLIEAGKVALTPDQEAGFAYERGVTYLRLGETENCVNCQGGESCIIPIRGGGVHQHQAGSRMATNCFQKALAIKPDLLQARWLLNVTAMTLGEYPGGVPSEFLVPPGAFESSVEFPRFHNIAKDVGLNTVNCGGGAIAEDFDGDGLFDMLISAWDPGAQIRYFRNAGDGTFIEQTQGAGLMGLFGGINMVQADYDNDGLVDVYVVRGAWLAQAGLYPNSLLKNLGGGRFRDVTFDVGLAAVQLPTPTAGWADYDNDGDLDLYVGHEQAPSQLYRNDGPHGFINVTQRAGISNNRFTKAVSWGDYNNDRLPDLYISNLDGPNRLYRNNGNGGFTDVAELAGVTRPMIGFDTWFWDVNNDGAIDLFAASYDRGVTHVARDYLGLPHLDEPDCLYLGDGRGGFREVAQEFGLTRSTQPMGANFGDLDNDGFPDFYLGTGYPEYDALMPNLMFHNRGGVGFDDVTFAGGFGHLQKGHGTVFADLDNDGDQDVFMQVGGAFPGDVYGDLLFENPGFGNHWLRIKLVGTKSNRSAIGARIRAEIVDGSTRRNVYKWVNSGGNFGGNPLEQHLGLASTAKVDVLEIYWPTSDSTQRFENVEADQRIEIEESEATIRPMPMPPARFRTVKIGGT